jgi:hypothetical protein
MLCVYGYLKGIVITAFQMVACCVYGYLKGTHSMQLLFVQSITFYSLACDLSRLTRRK